MKYLFLISMMVLSLACNKSDDSKGSGGGKPGGPNGDVITGFDEKVTDLTKCAGAPAANSSITANPWNQTTMQDNFTLAQRLVATTNSLSLAVKCSSNGKSAIAKITVDAKITADKIEILSDGADQQEFEAEAGQKSACSIELKKGTLVNYTFRGPCLAILANETLLFVPAQ